MFNLKQNHFSNEWVTLIALKELDFEKLYKVASDPLIWKQHPNKSRYKREVFENFFKGAMESGGAFLIINTQTGEPIGSSRFCNYDEAAKSIEIGYTFYSKDCWGKPFNNSCKKLMINYAFQFIDTINFVIGVNNIRSQKAIERLGAIKIREEEVAYFGEASQMNFIYTIEKKDWEIFEKPIVD